MITNTIFNKLRKALPRMSTTEQEALDAGTTWWDKELFSGDPNWEVLNYDPNTDGLGVSAEAQMFLDVQVQTLCEMLDDYSISQRGDLPPHIWTFLRASGFFGMVIAKEYGGLGFNAREHSEVVMKIATRSIAAAVTVMVPNSLGPGELLQHYGTETEKRWYLPKLADGTDLPCFALTNPHAGSDASSIPDVGIVVRDTNGDLALRVTCNKRYITLAPVATVVGLAIKVQDPDNLLLPHLHDRLLEGSDITLLLLPTSDHPELEIGERHDPLDIAFMNGPVRANDMLVPITSVLGGEEMIGMGWSMLMECLSAGRAVSLPSLACAGGKVASIRTGAYARIRNQFRLPIGKFEGVEEKLATIAGYTHIMDAARTMTLDAVDLGEKPSVLSAIVKYHLTEMNREVIDAAMDIQGGSGICLGPQNYIGKSYQSIPISITVEGANIMTRNLIIFGQGAIRNHPYAYQEMGALRDDNLGKFKSLLGKHVVHFLKVTGRSLFHGLTSSVFSRVQMRSKKPRTVRQVNRFSAAFAFVTDVSMMLLGGGLKRKERVSARLGDILSYLYMLSAIYRKRSTEVMGGPQRGALYDWSQQHLLYKMQEAFFDLFNNFPVPAVGTLMRLVVFPYGRTFKKPSDALDHTVARILATPSDVRDILKENIFLSGDPDDQTYKLERAFNGADYFDHVMKNKDMLLPSEEEYVSTHSRLRDEIVQVDSFNRE